MRIVFDATSMPRRRAGAGNLMYYLGRALAAGIGGDDLLLLDRFNAFADLGQMPGVEARAVRAGGRVARIGWEQALLPAHARRWRADVLHGAHHSLPLLSAGAALVTTVHDVTFDLLPRRYTPARRWYMRLSTRLGLLRADRAIVSSTWVRDALVRRYRYPAGRIDVVPLAPPPWMARVTDLDALAAVRARHRLPSRFLLSVGTREPGKNRRVLLDALRELRRRGMSLPLMVVGGRGWLEDGAGGPESAEDVVALGYVPDRDLAAIYTLADALLFPSLLEGFGLPPVEALACGTPVIASDRPAMPEVLGDAALYADPRRPLDWADAIERLLSDPTVRDQLRRRAAERVARYSWERAARETLAVYRRALPPARDSSPPGMGRHGRRSVPLNHA